MTALAFYASPLGKITLASRGLSLCGLWLEGQTYFASTLKEEAEERTLPIFEATKHWLDVYFKGENPDFTPELSLEGSSFQRAVWALLLKIPYGQTTTYKAIAHELARQKGLTQMSSQAVGGAVGRNPISLIVPCHRVIGSNGSLTGYAGGLDKKRDLLLREGLIF